MKIGLLFCQIDEAKHYENIDVSIKDPSAFKSAEGVAVDVSRKQNSNKPVYMYIDEEETQTIE